MLEIRFSLSKRSIKSLRHLSLIKSILNGLNTMSVSVTVTVTRFEFEHCQMTIHEQCQYHNKHFQMLKLVKSSTYTKQKHKV